MPIRYPEILTLREQGRRSSYTDRETMLYALAIGLGTDPLNDAERPFVYERELRAMPTLATVVAWGPGITPERMGLNYTMVVHGEEETILHRPMPAAAELVGESSIVGMSDKGREKGAFITTQAVLRDARDNQPLATLRRTIAARGDGGFGGPSANLTTPHSVPTRPPDTVLTLPTAKNQAALYRLCSDRNPLHIDPQRAREAGFKAPILHGLCTYGIACRAVLQAYCDLDPTRVYSHAARFSSPVYPGETLTFKLWRDGDVVSFEAEVRERHVTVLKGGKTVIGPPRAGAATSTS
jgi:acyl dehydratase